MIPLETLAIVFGLTSALSWGAGDFAGGYASRRTGAYTVVLATQITGIIIFPVLAFVFSESLPPMIDLMWGAFAGFFGAAGLIALYLGMSRGMISITATLAAVIGVVIPVVYSALSEGVPSILKIAGFVFALVGIWSIVRRNGGSDLKVKDLEYPLLAGILYGLFFISIDNFSSNAIYWPLTVSRIPAMILLTGFLMVKKEVHKTAASSFALALLAGIFNTGGAVLFALASGAGRLDIATILSSLSPVITVLLACILLKEQLAMRQWVGVMASMVAIVLISV